MPTPSRYLVASTESYPSVKRVAVAAVLRMTTYDAGTPLSALARAVTASGARRQALEHSARPLYHAGATSTGAVIYPQMGGITSDAASVMVVTRQTVVSANGDRRIETRTLDVRLVRLGGSWVFDRLASAGGSPVPRPTTLSPQARAVLDNPRISLPDTARWDIYRGVISPTLLSLMARIAQRAPYAVTVLETGHPYDVFGTNHTSMHSAGRAVDINLFAGRHVVDQHGVGSPAYDFVRWLLAQPQIGQVGSPWDLDGASSRSFTNGVHLDHVHVSV